MRPAQAAAAGELLASVLAQVQAPVAPGQTQQQTMGLLTTPLAERGGALLRVTHDPALARKVADRCVSVKPVAPRSAADTPA